MSQLTCRLVLARVVVLMCDYVSPLAECACLGALEHHQHHHSAPPTEAQKSTTWYNTQTDKYKEKRNLKENRFEKQDEQLVQLAEVF